MSNVVTFVPKLELNAKQNTDDFILMCRNRLTVFGADLNFDENIWDLSNAIKLKGRRGKRVRLPFSTLETSSNKKYDVIEEPFLSFSKAVFRYMYGIRPAKNASQRFTALRALECALRENNGGNEPWRLNADTFNRAAQLLNSYFTAAVSYRLGIQLELLVEFITVNRFVAVPIEWKNSIKRPCDTVRIGKEFEERRNAKLPSEAALHAIPRLFQIVTEPFDTIVVSIAAILCSAPDRINEVLLLPWDCEVRQKTKKNIDAYGLRWWPAKGADPMVKWIVPSMVEVVSDAISKIRRVTSAARAVAQWYESNPSELYLPDELEFLRSLQNLSLEEANLALYGGKSEPKAVKAWCGANDVKILGVGKNAAVRFSDLEKAIISKLPSDFPFVSRETGLKFADALFLCQKNGFHSEKATIIGVVESVSVDQINTGLGGRAKHGFESVFQRHGFAEADGSAINLRTHQPRHYLNTLAQIGGLSQLDIAKWSGRKDIRQNEAYDHVPSEHLVQKIRDAIGDNRKIYGPLSELPKKLIIHRDEFSRLKVPTAHTTEFGACIHDYTMAPCQLHADCFSCNEHVCIKGDEIQNSRIRAELVTAKENMNAAAKAHEDGTFGASRWVEHNQLIIDRLTQLCVILDDPLVERGAVIQLSNLPNVSRIERSPGNQNTLYFGDRDAVNPESLRLSGQGSAMEGKNA